MRGYGPETSVWCGESIPNPVMYQINIKPLAVPNDFNAHACLRVFLGL
jgi:hypothetical protein